MIYITADNGCQVQINGELQPVVTQETHTFSNEVCSQTLEDGRAYKDHVVNNADKVTVVLHVGNIDGPALSLLYETLRKICDDRALTTITTTVEEYTNMAIEQVSVPIVAPYKGRADITLDIVRIDIVGSFTRNIVTPSFQVVKGIGVPSNTVVAYDKVPDSNPEIEEEEIPEIPIIPIQTETIGEETEEELSLRQKLINALKSLPGKAKAAALETFAAIKSNPLGFAKSVMDSIQNGFPSGTLMGFLPDGCRNLVTQSIGVWIQAQIGYNSLLNCFDILFKTSDGKTQYSGALLPGCNGIKGINLKDENGEFPLKGVFLLTMSENAEKTPNAFAKNEETKAADCYILVFNNEAEAAKYEKLMSGDEDLPLNYNFEDLDYEVL